MPFPVKPPKSRTRVIFNRRKPTSNMNSSAAPNQEDVADEEVVAGASPPNATMVAATMIPDLFLSNPIILDPLETYTSSLQARTINECIPFHSGDIHGLQYNDYGVPHVDRRRHVAFLKKWLEHLSPAYVAVDASRPWFLYWCLEGMDLLGEDLSVYRDRLVETARWMQNDTGGFGGGFGQMSHLATTYAVLLAISVVGGEALYEVVDRKAMWRWLCSLKQPDGGFCMATGGEEDVRGAYCAAVVISLLDLPLDLTPESPAWTPEGATLFTGLADYVQRCQTFEGGVSAKPDSEAHGAYAFCALACLSILDAPYRIIPKYLDVPRLISWLSSRQYAPEGGFSGRTNKLVDGCYSHWVGGCWPIIEACLNGASMSRNETDSVRPLAPSGGGLYSREGLIRYILCCCQDQNRRGGLRDKPSKSSDAYHTCYALAGLSSAQHVSHYSEDQHQWSISPYLVDVQIFDEEDRINTVHPIYVIPEAKVTAIKEYYVAKSGF